MNKLTCLFFLLFTFHLNSTEINFGISQNPQNIDPRYARDASSERLVDLVYFKAGFHGLNPILVEGAESFRKPHCAPVERLLQCCRD